MTHDHLLATARDIARTYHHKYIRTEHVILALFQSYPDLLAGTAITADDFAQQLATLSRPVCAADEKSVLSPIAERALRHDTSNDPHTCLRRLLQVSPLSRKLLTNLHLSVHARYHPEERNPLANVRTNAMPDTILVVDDEKRIIDLAKMYIEQEGYPVTSSTDGAQALDIILNDTPALVVLDLMLPGMDGLEVCRRVRAQSDVPIIMLTARSDDIDKIVGLELGADDYLTKPFNPRELVARIKAILRRSERTKNDQTQPVTIGNLTITPSHRSVVVGGETIDLRMKEFDLLLTLAENPNIVFSREKLLNVVWGYDFAGETRTVDVHIAHLRHKLEKMEATIETVWGVGYKLVV